MKGYTAKSTAKRKSEGVVARTKFDLQLLPRDYYSTDMAFRQEITITAPGVKRRNMSTTDQETEEIVTKIIKNEK